MVGEIIAGPITEIINNRILGNPIFHRYGKKTKTKTIVLSTSQMSRVHSLGQFIPSLGISSRSLERVNLTKLLGIHFSEHLSWEDCMSTNCQKSCHSALGILRKIKNFTRNTYLAITLAKLKLSPVRLGTGWVTNIVLKVPTCSFFVSYFRIVQTETHFGET